MAARRWIKWTVIVLVAIVVLLFAAVATALLLVDTQAVRGVIENRVEATTGRELRIEGPLDVALFPWLGFELGRTRLANAEGFAEVPFAALEEAQLRVRLIPLLTGDVALDRVVVRGLALNLARNAQGRSNWDDLVGAAAGEAGAGADGAPADEGEPEPPAEPTALSLRVDGVELRQARLTWDDATTGQRVTVRDLELTAGRLEPGRSTPVELGMRVEPEGGPRTDLSAAGDLTYRLDGPRATLSGLEASLDARGDMLAGGRLRASMSGDVAVDAGKGRATIENLVLTAVEQLEATGRLESAFGGETTSVAGRLQLAPFNPRKLARALAIELPPTADSKALRRAEAGFAFSGTPSAVELDDFEGRVDDTAVTGSARVALAEVPRLRADLEADRIDLDRYMAPPAKGAPGAGSGGGDGADAGKGEAAADPVATLPLEALRGVVAELHAGIGSALYQGLEMADVRLDARVADGALHIDHAGLAAAGGRIEAKGRLDGRTDEPAVRFDTSIAEVQAEPLLAALTGEPPIVVGRLDTTLSGQTAGPTLDAWTRALNGRFDATFRDGALRGINLAQRLRVIGAKLKGGDVEAAEAERQTDFSVLRISGRIRNGVVKSNDLDLRSPLLRVSGAGEADLADETVDYTARVLITKTLAGQGGAGGQELAGLEVPVRFKGPWASPGIDIQLDEVLKERAKAEAERKVEEKKQEAKAELEGKKQEKKKKLDKKKEEAKKELEGLFD